MSADVTKQLSELTMSKEGKHHYIPKFYLKQWAGDDHRLCEFSRPYRKVEPRRVHPDGTGFVHGLYTVPGLPPEQAQYVETKYMKATDDLAAKALYVFRSPGGPDVLDLSAKQKVGWSRFLYSLIVRNPENIERMRRLMPQGLEDSLEKLRGRYYLMRGPADPETFDEFKEAFSSDPRNVSPQIALPRIINSFNVIHAVSSFHFFTITVHKSKHRLLTSDRPIIMTNGLVQEDAHIAIPISPSCLFVAVRNDETYEKIKRFDANQLVTLTNWKVVEQARMYVYGADDSQRRFVENRLGKCVPSTPLD